MRASNLIVRTAISFSLLCSIPAAAADAAEQGGSADLVLFGGHVHTVDPGRPEATALAIKNGRILAVGGDAEIMKYKGAASKLLNLKGRLVLPGFIESHAHTQFGGAYVSNVALRDARTLAEVKRRVAAYAKEHPGTGWIVGEAWSYGYPDMPNGAPTRQMLDEVAPDRPVYLSSGMAHAGWANSKALRMAGITAKTPSPEGGEIVRDASGKPTGWLKETAVKIVTEIVPKPT